MQAEELALHVFMWLTADWGNVRDVHVPLWPEVSRLGECSRETRGGKSGVPPCPRHRCTLPRLFGVRSRVFADFATIAFPTVAIRIGIRIHVMKFEDYNEKSIDNYNVHTAVSSRLGRPLVV